MRLKSFLLLICFFIVYKSAYNQEKYNNISTNEVYDYALEAYNTGNFTTAASLFKDIFTDKQSLNFHKRVNSLYYLANSYKELQDYASAEKFFIIFLNDYSESIHCNSVRLNFAEIKFLKHEYREAIEAYNNINPNSLDKKTSEKYYFNKGYAYLRTKKYALALANFVKIKDSSEKYWNSASYYYAHILFEQNQYADAYPIFKQIQNDPNYGNEAKHYMIRILSYQQNYKELLQTTKTLGDLKNKKDNKETQAIIAEAYYKTEQYSKAIPLLETALKNKANTTFYYYLGDCYYHEKDFNKALINFEKAALDKNETGQTASFYLGLCNIILNNKPFATSAFHNAYKMNFNKSVSEAALFNYANTVYETGFDPFNEAIIGLQNYLNNNKTSDRHNEAQTLLANLFLSTKNFQNALQTINSIDIKSENLKLAHQKINYSGALEKYFANDFGTARKLFIESQKHGVDKLLSAEAQYWIAETYYKQKKYSNAAIQYKKFLKMPKAQTIEYYNNTHYALGYCYFKQKKYQDSEIYFSKYITNSVSKEKDKRSDAWNRIGDCYFISNEYNAAINAYNNAIKVNSDKSGYPQYYQALAYGAGGDLSNKVKSLQTINNMPQHTYYRSNALFELGNTFTIMEENEKAIASFQKLIAEYPRSPYNIKAKQKIGLLYFGQGDFSNGEFYFKDIIEKYPGTLEAQESLASLKNMYIDNNDVESFMSYIENNTNIKISVSQADSMSFAGAQKLFSDKEYTKAKQQLQRYIKDFPEGAFKATALYYLGECFYMEKDYNQAITKFEAVLKFPHSLYTESSKTQLSNIYMQQKNYYKAIKINKELIESTEYDFVANEANINLMRCYYHTSEYDNLSKQCLLVQKIINLDKDIFNESQYYYANALYGLGNYTAAYKEFAQLATKMKNIVGAEAKYFCAFIKYIQADYTNAETEAFELINQFGNYDFWVARGFILLGDIYVKTDNIFQAKQTYQSIIDNYQGDDLKSEAQNKLDKIADKEE